MEVARRARLRVWYIPAAHGPVLGLALFAAVAPLPAIARGQRRVGIGGLETADVARSPIPLPKFTASWPVILPIRALAFDATVRIGFATTTNSESRRVRPAISCVSSAIEKYYDRMHTTDRGIEPRLLCRQNEHQIRCPAPRGSGKQWRFSFAAARAFLRPSLGRRPLGVPWPCSLASLRPGVRLLLLEPQFQPFSEPVSGSARVSFLTRFRRGIIVQSASAPVL